MVNVKTDVLIIGAGPSGAVAAAYLHKQGIDVKVVEKNKFPRFVIGESLLPRCMHHFEEVGFIDCISYAGFEIKKGARFLRNEIVCEFDFSKKHTEGYDWTWQLPRAEFDKILTDEIEKRGVDISFEEEVVDVKFNADGSSKTVVKALNGIEYTIEAKFIIDSSGYGRVLPRLLNLEKPSEIPKNSSIFTHVKDVNRPEGREGTIITFDVFDHNCWLWVIPFSDGNTSIGFVGNSEYMETFKGDASERLRDMFQLSEHYRERFQDVDFLFEPISIKNFSKSVTKLYGKGYALTGNSAEFLDPIFSSGVTFATESALRAAKLVTQELKGKSVDWEKDFSDYMKEGVAVFGSYVKEWYTGNLQTVFFEGDTNPEIKKQICAVLAGYVWDKTNPFVKKHDRIISTLAHVIKLEA
ncbi:NAD(P)/FAD-dependent oxidoreductase [Winogradskyella ursingii]|uniref:NAD(P)/FAD-dependent oxidoreductase n=1 Tax=Winogradskyella ursingii TaxID=2686079 RepID=UPI0015CC9D7C|nr:NAD(P)/FAD-dependent oxidoreductase [Winogradskyella ursingii]